MSKDIRYRIGGIVAIAIGVVMAWWAIWRPLQAARAQAPVVQFHPKLFVLVPVCLVFGLFFLFCGDRLEYRDAEQKKLTPLGWALFAVTAVLAGVSYWWWQGRFAALGYGG